MAGPSDSTHGTPSGVDTRLPASPPAERKGSSNGERCAWPPLDWFERVVLLLTALVLMVLLVPRLPPGVCFGDSGGLQLAAATLGITHPPGYAGYVSLGYLATSVPGVSPAYMVTLLTFAAGMPALLLCVLMQKRLGVPIAVAAALALALTAHRRIWFNLLTPEVYMPSLTGVAGAAYLLVKYARLGRRRELACASVLFGFVLANRPPVVLSLPFFVIALLWIEKRRNRPWLPAIKVLGMAAGLAVLPMFYSFGYVWARDRHDTAFNYIEQYNEEFHTLPDASEGWPAKFDRVVWHVTGRQFHDQWGNTRAGVRLKLIWLRNRLLPDRPLTFLVTLVLVLIGAVTAFRRDAVAALLVTGLGTASVVFVCGYRMIDDAADFLPLLFAVTVFGGVALSALLSAIPDRRRRWITGLVFATAVLFTLFHAPRRFPGWVPPDAEPYLAQVDLNSLPENAVICSTWGLSCPLWYAQHVSGQRPNVTIINAAAGSWPGFIDRYSTRPVFTTADPGELAGYSIEPYRVLWHVKPVGGAVTDRHRSEPEAQARDETVRPQHRTPFGIGPIAPADR